MDTNMIHINRIWWEIANTIRLSHFISSGVTPYVEEQLTLAVKWTRRKVVLSCVDRADSQGALEHPQGPMLSCWASLPAPSCNMSTFWTWAGRGASSQPGCVPELWSLKDHVTWSCPGGPRSDRINISLSLLWRVLADRGTQAGKMSPRSFPALTKSPLRGLCLWLGALGVTFGCFLDVCLLPYLSSYPPPTFLLSQVMVGNLLSTSPVNIGWRIGWGTSLVHRSSCLTVSC